MSILDRAIAWFSPQRALARERARYMLRSYAGASYDRRSSNWRARSTAANVEIGKDLRALRDRSRDLVRNQPHANRAIEIIVANAVGSGIRAVSRTGADRLDKQVTRLWDEWGEQADVEAQLSFQAMQGLALRSIVESGEVVVRLLDGPFPGRKSSIPFQVQLLESDFIDHAREGFVNMGGEKPGTIRSRLGVGLGEFDRRTGLWLWPYHPGEQFVINLRALISEFHGRDEVLHVFKPQRPGQVRGVPWFASMLTTARDYADFVDAVLVKARVEACFSGFVTNSDQLAPLFDQSLTQYQSSDAGAMISNLEPGTLKELKSGQDIKFANPTTTSQVEPVLLTCLMAMASGIGVTYDQMTGDLRQANYSSLRAGKLEFRRQIEQLQECYLIPMLLQPVWDRFIARAVLAGKLNQRQGGYPVSWVTPSWESINPRFDLEAEENSVRSGRTSPQSFIAEWGGDWRKVVDDWAEFNKYCDDREVILDIDPRQRTRSGSAQPEPKDAGAPASPARPNGARPNGNGKTPAYLREHDVDPGLEDPDDGPFSGLRVIK